MDTQLLIEIEKTTQLKLKGKPDQQFNMFPPVHKVSTDSSLSSLSSPSIVVGTVPLMMNH